VCSETLPFARATKAPDAEAEKKIDGGVARLAWEGDFILTGMSSSGMTLPMSPKLYTTREAAEHAGVSRQTVQAWIKAGRVKAPEITLPVGIRFWTKEDVAQLKRVEHKRFPRKAKAGK
jgi:hypothetical protein